MLRADPKKTSRADLDHAKKWVYGYQQKFGQSERPGEPYNPLYPDDTIAAQLCAILDPISLENFIHELMGSSPRPKPGAQYSWYITVALQRRYGIAPEVLRQRRSDFRIERYRGRALTGEQQPLIDEATDVKGDVLDPSFGDDLVSDAVKRMRSKRAKA